MSEISAEMQQSIQAQTLKDIQITNQIAEQAKAAQTLPLLELEMLRQENAQRQTEAELLVYDVRDLKLYLQQFSEEAQLQCNLRLSADERRVFELVQQIGELRSQIRDKMDRVVNLL